MSLRRKIAEWLVKATPFPKIIIGFDQSGCMATQLNFLWIGYVVKESVSEGGTDYYEVQPFIKGSTEHRNNPLKTVTAWQIQHLGFNLFIHYM